MKVIVSPGRWSPGVVERWLGNEKMAACSEVFNQVVFESSRDLNEDGFTAVESLLPYRCGSCAAG